jgi:hypothetical protein
VRPRRQGTCAACRVVAFCRGARDFSPITDPGAPGLCPGRRQDQVPGPVVRAGYIGVRVTDGITFAHRHAQITRRVNASRKATVRIRTLDRRIALTFHVIGGRSAVVCLLPARRRAIAAPARAERPPTFHRPAHPRRTRRARRSQRASPPSPRTKRRSAQRRTSRSSHDVRALGLGVFLASRTARRSRSLPRRNSSSVRARIGESARRKVSA